MNEKRQSWKTGRWSKKSPVLVRDWTARSDNGPEERRVSIAARPDSAAVWKVEVPPLGSGEVGKWEAGLG